ncbi:hypothetical protein [Streptomyces sp. NPDC048462]|uniref:hypothetical protein n=1 Tax=Streptomyces sp. NPDC048462 TaxID=3365555 RepID=UPI0037105657
MPVSAPDPAATNRTPTNRTRTNRSPTNRSHTHRSPFAALRLVVIGGALSYRALFNWTTPPMFVGTLLVGPLLQLLFFVFLGRQLQVADDRFYLLGNAVVAASTACVYGGTMAIANERRYGTLGAVLLSPRYWAPLWFGRALPYVLNGLFISAFTLSAACLLLGLRIPVGAVPGLAAVLLAAAAGCSAFGLALGALGLRLRDVFLKRGEFGAPAADRRERAEGESAGVDARRRRRTAADPRGRSGK